MSKGEIIAGLEVGSNKILCTIGKNEANKGISVLGVGSVHSDGLQNGMVVSIEEASDAVLKSVEIAENMANAKIDSLYVGIKGNHIETYNHRGAINISRTDKEITEDDRDMVLDSARQLQISSDREIIETIPHGFIVDKQNGVPNPIGMEGAHLGVSVHLITVSTMSLNNIYKSINKAGFKIDRLLYGSLVIGDLVITKEEKELGVILVDIGAHLTDLVVYLKGGVYFTTEINVGGDFVTKDIAYAMRSSFSTASDIKEKFGVAHNDFVDDSIDNNIKFLGVDGISERETTKEELSEIIHARVEEIFNMIKSKISENDYENMLPAGVVLTGGSAMLKGICEVGEEILGMPVRIGMPQNINRENSNNMIINPSYGTSLGLIKYAQRLDRSDMKRGKRDGMFDKMKKVLEEMF